MNKRIPIHGLMLAACALMCAGVQAASRPPNIILIMVDDLGYETIGAYGGSSYATPNVDRLAAEGVRFEYCFAQPVCTPSRVKLMTGMSNIRNYEAFGVLPRSAITFASVLKSGGYVTAIAGKWQLGAEKDSPQHFGFDESCLWFHTISGNKRKKGPFKGLDNRFVNPDLSINGEAVHLTEGEYGPDVTADFLCNFIKKNKDRPFLAYYPMILTHCPFVPTPDSKDWDPKSMGSKTYKGQAKHFGGMVEYMDKLVGRIVGEIEAQGLTEDTVILFTGDNGTDQPVVSMCNGIKIAGGKGKMTDAGTRVPLVVSWRGKAEPRVVGDLVDLSDFFPTLCSLAGVEVPSPSEMDGRSFLPQVLGEEGDPREHLYSWYSVRGDSVKARVSARTKRYKLYGDGKFFDLESDVRELTPLDRSALSEQASAVMQDLQGVIDQNASLDTRRRPQGGPSGNRDRKGP